MYLQHCWISGIWGNAAIIPKCTPKNTHQRQIPLNSFEKNLKQILQIYRGSLGNGVQIRNQTSSSKLSGTEGASKELIQQQFTLVQCVEDDKKNLKDRSSLPNLQRLLHSIINCRRPCCVQSSHSRVQNLHPVQSKHAPLPYHTSAFQPPPHSLFGPKP